MSFWCPLLLVLGSVNFLVGLRFDTPNVGWCFRFICFFLFGCLNADPKWGSKCGFKTFFSGWDYCRSNLLESLNVCCQVVAVESLYLFVWLICIYTYICMYIYIYTFTLNKHHVCSYYQPEITPGPQTLLSVCCILFFRHWNNHIKEHTFWYI